MAVVLRLTQPDKLGMLNEIVPRLAGAIGAFISSSMASRTPILGAHISLPHCVKDAADMSS